MKPPRARDKILRLETLVRRVAAARARGDRIVFTNGCFDLLHPGHLRSLEQARALGDRLIVAVNGDASVRRAKGPDRPLRKAARRMELVAGLACVDWVVGFSADTPIRLIERLRPDVLAKGGDWALDAIVGSDAVRSWGGRVVRLALVRDEGTTRELDRIRSRVAIEAGRAGVLRRSARRPGSPTPPPAERGGTRDRAARRSDRSRGPRRA